MQQLTAQYQQFKSLRDNCGTIVKSGNVWAQYLSRNRAIELLTAPSPHDADSSETDESSFTGTSSLAEASKLAQNGDKTLAMQIPTMPLNVIPNTALALLALYDTAGEPIVDRYLDKEPDCYQEEVLQAGKTLELIVPITFNYNVSQSELLNQLGLVVAAIEQLESQGYGIGITVEYSTARSSDGQITSLVRVKEANEYISKPILAFWLAHTSSLRRIGFKLWELAPEPIRQICEVYSSGGYGREENTLSLGKLLLNASNQATCTLPMRKQLTRLSIEQSINSAL